MDEMNPYAEPSAAPAPAPESPRRRIPRVAWVAALTGLFGLGGAGIAVAASNMGVNTASPAASSSSTTLPGGATPKMEPGMKGHGRFGGAGGPGFGMNGGAVVHGTYTVKDGTGYKTEAVQVGTVSAVNGTSITVKSSDGYEHTYKVLSTTIVDAQSGGISAVKTTDEVHVQATTDSSGDTATNIVDATQLKASGKGFGFGGGRPGMRGGFPGGPFGPAAGPAAPVPPTTTPTTVAP